MTDDNWDWNKWEAAVEAEIPNFMLVRYIASGIDRVSFEDLANAITSPKEFERRGQPEWHEHFLAATRRACPPRRCGGRSFLPCIPRR